MIYALHRGPTALGTLNAPDIDTAFVLARAMHQDCAVATHALAPWTYWRCVETQRRVDRSAA